MEKRTASKSLSLSTFIPKSKSGQITLTIAALACLLGSAFYAGASATQLEQSAQAFVSDHQYIDQRPYRSMR